MPGSTATRGHIQLKNETVYRMENFNVSRGFPLPPGAVREAREVSIREENGKEVPSAGKVLQRRPDGSIEWVLVDFVTTLEAEEKKSVYLELKPTEGAEPPNPVRVEETDEAIKLSNGLAALALPKRGGSLLARWTIHGRELVGPYDKVELETLDMGGKIYRASLSSGPKARRVSVEHANPIRATVLVEGTHTARDGSTFLDFALRFTLATGCADVQIDHTFYCREAAEGVISVRAIRLVIPTRMSPDAKKVVRQSHTGQEYRPRSVSIAENAELVSSSVDNLDQYTQNFKPYQEGILFLRNLASFHEQLGQYPYHMRPDFKGTFRPMWKVGTLRQIFPYVGWQSPQLSLVFSMQRWDKLHPKSINLDENVMTVSFWPEWAAPLQIVQGVSKTHTMWITGEPRALEIDEVMRHGLRWEISGLDPVAISIDPAWSVRCEALEVNHMLRYQPQKYPFLENLIEAFPAAGNPDRFTYYRLAGSGMLNFGDIGGESGFTNNEDDVQVLFPLVEYLRTGNVYCFDAAQETAKHYMEVDFCEFSSNPRQHGSLIAHTQNHYEGMTYPSHQWSEGLLAYYYLTGDERAKKVVQRVGDNMIYWTEHLLDGITLDGREAGMPLVNLAAAYTLTRDKKYLAAAQTIIDNFHRRWFNELGQLKYPYPQWAHTEGGAHHKNIEGYGDWSSFVGMYRIWEHTRDEELKTLLVNILKEAMRLERFQVNDARTMDFLAAWIYLRLTGDIAFLDRIQPVIPMLLRRGGHPTRRLHFLKELDDRGMIDEKLVGSRGGVI